ncbi:hypothetical protein [cf. Phormidesmis sp. LEGE 11477]|uniref:hypothetical protein n=1 Tax=cf. Phormidesmis sp. LEGE 11477 TaxID=1828680 RepID=UPI001881A953|nr:hypothetical protein [cf. Phormidesmis sp. LEGE 11477]MBE9061613.1 hypothetical protein [cf. Phormidesmis sp. LEGE 11477]
MKKLLSAFLSSVGEIAAWLETDPAILSIMPCEMASFDTTAVEISAFESNSLGQQSDYDARS